MKNLLEYEDFLNESNGLAFPRHTVSRGYQNTYDQRAGAYKGVSTDPGILSKVGNFFQKMEDRLNAMASYGQQQAQATRAARGNSKFNTGYELLFGLPSVVPGVLKRIFGGTNYEYKNVFADEGKADLEFMRHTNEEFAKKELPGIRNEDQLSRNIEDLYKKGGVKPGQSAILDDIARNRANLYYQYQQNPQSVVTGN